MEIEKLQETIPDYARDLKINLGNVLQQVELNEAQTWGTAVACAIAARNTRLTAAVLADAAGHLNEAALGSAKAAAAIMGMNNILYRFRHLVTNEKYGTLPARLRMQAIRGHGGDPVDFELFSLAVSAINGCAACVNAHEHVLLEKGLSEEVVMAAVRIAATFHAVAAVLDAESSLA
jgi:lipoyl-dependent peroxiredoxin subunit D